jgi:CheY-like chemotaxis protein
MPDRGSVRVLLIDDEAAGRAVLARLLRSCGAEVVGEAGDGVVGLDLLRGLGQRGVDLIITDCQMPVMDGLAFTQAVRAAGDRTPVLMLSALGHIQVIDAARTAGVNRYLRKPVELDALLEAIRQVTGVLIRAA